MEKSAIPWRRNRSTEQHQGREEKAIQAAADRQNWRRPVHYAAKPWTVDATSRTQQNMPQTCQGNHQTNNCLKSCTIKLESGSQ